MICFINRKLLCIESDPQQVGFIKNKLQQAGIPYTITPITRGNGFSRSIDAKMAAGSGMRFSQYNHATFSYRIFVLKKDYNNARKNVYGINESTDIH